MSHDRRCLAILHIYCSLRLAEREACLAFFGRGVIATWLTFAALPLSFSHEALRSIPSDLSCRWDGIKARARFLTWNALDPACVPGANTCVGQSR
eukprot:6204000-Pleurochrysis_carterae.AAC.1